MNNYKSKLNSIRLILGLQVKLASEKLNDGKTIVEAEEFAPGAELMVVAEDGGKSPAPAGEHITESGKKIVVDDAGKIVSVEEGKSLESDEEIKVETEAEKVKMAEDAPIDGSEPEKPIKEKLEEKVEEKIDEKVQEAMQKVMAAMEPMLKDMADMKEKMGKMEEKYSAFAKAPAAGKIPTLSENTNNATTLDIVDRFKELKSTLK
jgi:flagellar biosynthesis GTPase FlhF